MGTAKEENIDGAVLSLAWCEYYDAQMKSFLIVLKMEFKNTSGTFSRDEQYAKKPPFSDLPLRAASFLGAVNGENKF